MGEISRGLLVLTGITHGDGAAQVAWMADKLVNLRIFEDAEGKMNLSVLEVGGGILAVSQFTLYGDTSRGRRPSFITAARPEQAEPLFAQFVEELRTRITPVATGVFQTHMDVHLVNDGPVTLVIDTPGP